MKKQVFLSQFQKFIKTESLAGILLFGAAIIALIWANSPFGSYYQELWQYKAGISFHDFELKKPLILWINDGLMAIFFFLIGLELKRELLVGEINTVKKAAFPVLAALGGVLIPVILYLSINNNPETLKGWGIPMATDIAFALAILNTLGKRVPLNLKIFLSAFAIIDDIVAVLVIAFFYSTGIHWDLVFYGLALIGLLGLFYKKYRYSFALGISLSVVVWYLFLKSGIHPTIAGVLLAFTIPVKRRIDVREFSENINSISSKLTGISGGKNHLLTSEELDCLDNLDELNEKVRSPLQSLEHSLHNVVAYFILPVFAFANAGVMISRDFDFNTSLIITIIISLFAGKFAGITLFSYLGLKLKLTTLPAGVDFKQILGMAAIAGVGFTMSIFIANLAFAGEPTNINSAKIGIIIGSLISGITGYVILKKV